MPSCNDCVHNKVKAFYVVLELLIVMAVLVASSSVLSAMLVLSLIPLTVTTAVGNSATEVVPLSCLSLEKGGQQELLSLAWIKYHFAYNICYCAACKKAGGKTILCVAEIAMMLMKKA